MNRPNLISALVIPDSLLAKEATDLLREYSTDLLFTHSLRVYLSAAEQGGQQKLRFDPELLYVAAAFHDLGLIKKFSSQNERFEVDSANVARQFLNVHNIAEDQVQTVWQAIALHTTPGIPKHMRPEVALLNSGVLLDVLGVRFDQFPKELREENRGQVPAHKFQRGLYSGVFRRLAHEPATTYGTVNASVCEIHRGVQEPQRLRLDRCVSLSGLRIPKFNVVGRTCPVLQELNTVTSNLLA